MTKKQGDVRAGRAHHLAHPSARPDASRRLGRRPGADLGLHVVSGVARVQTSGGPAREIRPGDTVWTPPGEKHWHGAAPTTAMVHLAMQEALDGKQIDRLEHVTQELYRAESG